MSKAIHLDEIDFIKGLSAISVIFLHTLPYSVLIDTFAVFHIWQAVPMFLFISFYLGFRNLEKKESFFKGYYSKERFKKIFLRIWLPLLVLAVIEALFFIVIGNKGKAVGSILCYYNGPGSYYVWCYMQIWLLIPVIYFLFMRSGIAVGGGILLIFGVLLDFLWERYIDFNVGFTCFRYLFLSVPAFMYLKGFNGKRLIPYVVFSMIYLVLMLYSNVPLYADPILPDGWEAQTSLGFFYTLGFFLLLSKIYTKLRTSKLKQYITHVGTISWEVFLIQMVLIGSESLDAVNSKLFDSAYLQIPFKVIAALSISLLFAEIYNKVLRSVFQAK
jgi:peptidoglycan/LPS O-acetylase OafA/YrhL